MTCRARGRHRAAAAGSGGDLRDHRPVNQNLPCVKTTRLWETIRRFNIFHALFLAFHSSRVTYLVLALEHEHVGDLAEGNTQVDDLRLGDLVGNVADVDHAGRRTGVFRVQLDLQKRKVEQG